MVEVTICETLEVASSCSLDLADLQALTQLADSVLLISPLQHYEHSLSPKGQHAIFTHKEKLAPRIQAHKSKSAELEKTIVVMKQDWESKVAEWNTTLREYKSQLESWEEREKQREERDKQREESDKQREERDKLREERDKLCEERDKQREATIQRSHIYETYSRICQGCTDELMSKQTDLKIKISQCDIPYLPDLLFAANCYYQLKVPISDVPQYMLSAVPMNPDLPERIINRSQQRFSNVSFSTWELALEVWQEYPAQCHHVLQALSAKIVAGGSRNEDAHPRPTVTFAQQMLAEKAASDTSWAWAVPYVEECADGMGCWLFVHDDL